MEMLTFTVLPGRVVAMVLTKVVHPAERGHPSRRSMGGERRSGRAQRREIGRINLTDVQIVEEVVQLV